MNRSLLVAFGLFTLVACDSGSAPYDTDPAADSAYRIVGTCTARAACDDDYDACIATGVQACRTCYEIGGLGCSAYCDYTPDCRRWHCGPSGACTQWSYTATLGEQDPAIRETCEMAAARRTTCGEAAYPAGSCELFAATERPQVAGIYQCIASSPCGEDAACDDTEPDDVLAGSACDAADACDVRWSFCDDGLFASWLGWLRSDVKRALRQCTELPTCGERLPCFTAWLSSVAGE